MSSIATELLIVFGLILANGVFAMSEAAVVASRKSRLQSRADAGDKRAAAALALAQDPNRFLSTVQIGITLIGIFAGAFGGAGLAKFLANWIQTQFPTLGQSAQSLGLGATVAIIGFFSLVIGELVPKRIALQNPEKIAALMAAPMGFIARFAAPFVWLLGVSSALILRILGTKDSTEPEVTEEEIKVMVSQGTQSGVFHEQENEMIDRVFRLGDKRVSALMTRRPEIVWLDLEKPWDENATILATSPFSRVPVGRGNSDRLEGIVRAKDLLSQIAQGQNPDITSAMQPVLFVPEAMSAFKFLETLRGSKTHMAVVVDEYGATQGVLTLHDILESLVGELPQVDDSDAGYATLRADGSFLIEALMPVDEFKLLFDLDEIEGENSADSVSGLILEHLGAIPREGQILEFGGLQFEILDMDGQRIDKIGVKRI